MTLNSSLYTSDKQSWETPDCLFSLLAQEFNFTLDVCADLTNTKCGIFYSVEQDALLQDWCGICWMNPPYGKGINKWVKKASDESKKHGSTVVCLLPVRSDTRWWHMYVMQGEIRLLNKRLTFKGSNNKAPFPAAIVIFGPGICPGKVKSQPIS